MIKKRNSKAKAAILSILLLISTLFLNVQPSQAQCHIDDWTALKALYESTDGDNWRYNTGWEIVKENEPSTDCNLENLKGVELDENGRVEDLILDANNLEGNIPAELGNLSRLRKLYLHNNELNGSISVELCNLSELRRLYLSKNQLSGSIPNEIGNLTKLRRLHFDKNQLNGIIPIEIGFLINLTELFLDSNELSGSIPIEFSNLFNLTDLSLYNNQISGNIPGELGDLSNLNRLLLYDNNLSGCFDINLNKLCDEISTYTVNKGNNFKASWERFCLDGIVACENSCHIDDWKALKGFYFELYGLFDGWFDGLQQAHQVGSTPPQHCDFNTWDGIIVNEDGRITEITLSKSDYRQETGPPWEFTPKEFGFEARVFPLPSSVLEHLSGLIELQVLELQDFNLSGEIPSEIGNLSNLEELILLENDLNGNIPPELGDLSNLTSLSLSENQLNGNIPPELGKLSNLTSLSLGRNQLNGNIPAELGNLINLTYLSFGGSELTWLASGGNQLSGNIPPELGKLTNLTYLNLKENQLSGDIPPELGNLTNLTYLILFDNQLIGSIPPELGGLINLKHLNLSNNQLSGSIPSELGNLINLHELSLYNNELTGIVPEFNMNPEAYTSFYLPLTISHNHFTCSDISANFQHNNEIDYFVSMALPQNFNPLNYDSIKANIFDKHSVNLSLKLNIEFPFDITGFTYQWYRNGNVLPEATNPTLNLDTIQPNNVGKYTLRLTNENCLPDGNTFETISEPIYVILKGYDLYGQPVDYTQLMVEFEDQATKDQYEQEIILDNGGIWVDKCDCNRELHLYDFPDDESSIEAAYIALDLKIVDSAIENEIDGGFNYKLNNIGLDAISTSSLANTALFGDQQNESSKRDAYTVNINYPSGSYQDEVIICELDSGLDIVNNNYNNQLYQSAPENCYNLTAPGYNFSTIYTSMTDAITPIDINYQDNIGHGTFVFNIIAEGLEDASNAKIIPLKVIENATEGSLFDLVCAMSYAVDHNANVINISAGYRGEPSGIMENVLYEARKKDIFVVVASGNDGLNIDGEGIVPQYPAFFSGKYFKFYTEDESGITKLDSLLLNNVISVGNINVNGELNEKSNYGENSVTIAAPGEDIFSKSLAGIEAVGTGTSFSTPLVSQVLAREIARDNTRSVEQIWEDFENQYLVSNPNLADKTSTGKQIDFSWQQKTNIEGCTDCTACNYWPYATVDDGSCTYCSEDAEELACDNGDFEYCPPCVLDQGCTDIAACNYNPGAIINNGSCLYGNNCGNQIDIVSCPANEAIVICSPVNTTALSLEDFVTTGNVTLLSNLSLQVIEKTDNYKYYNTTTYDYIISDGAGNQSICQSQYYIAKQFLQAPEITYSPQVCEDDLWSYLKLGGDEYKIYEDENGSKGEELTVCNMPYCSTYGLGVNTATPGMHQFWVSQFFTFPDGSICESEASLFQMFIEPKPTASLSTQNININIGENIALMDVVTNNTSGYWSGKNIIHLTNTNGENITYFSANTPGLYKLYYTVSNTYCDQNYLLIATVGASTFASKEKDGFVEDDYQINKVDFNTKFNLYPNPSSGKVFIELNSVSKESPDIITIFDIYGKILHRDQIMEEQVVLNVSHLPKGIYMVEVRNANIRSTQKLLIE